MELPQTKTTVVIASVVLLGAAVAIWQTFRAPAINQQPFLGVGQVLAEQTAKLLQDRGRVVAVITADHQQPGNPLHTQWEAFQGELKKHSGITMAATETIVPDPNDPQADTAACSLAAFASVLERHAQADAIVFFVGLPGWHWLEERNLVPRSIGSKIIVLGSTSIGAKQHYEPYFLKEIVSVLVIRWASSPSSTAKPRTPREWFDQEYQILTPQNYQSLPEPNKPVGT